MDDVTQRRLIGAATLFVFAFAVAALLPDHERDRALPANDEDSAPQVVVYDLRDRPSDATLPAKKSDAPAMPVPFKPATPVLTLEPPKRTGASLGWFVQLGSYATSASAKSALARAHGAGYSGAVQMIEKDKKKLYRARLGPFGTQREAYDAQQEVAGLGFGDARMIELWKP